MTERIAKRIAAAGVCSRRDAEKYITDGRVKVNGALITSPALNVTEDDVILIDDTPLPRKALPKLWRFYKPCGVITTQKDPQNRKTLFDILPKNLSKAHIISIGRLDLNSEGLILLTTSGELSRYAELPKTAWARCYRVRVHGTVDMEALKQLKKGITIEGVTYGAIEVDLIRQTGSNSWLYMLIREGKNREIRKVLNHFGLQVNKLIRVAYGPFELKDLKPGECQEIPHKEWRDHFKEPQSQNIKDSPKPKAKTSQPQKPRKNIDENRRRHP